MPDGSRSVPAWPEAQDPAVVTLWGGRALSFHSGDAYVAWRRVGGVRVMRIGRSTSRQLLPYRPPNLVGFDWGSRSRGAYLLARSLIADATDNLQGIDDLAPILVTDWVASRPRSGFTLPVDALRLWAGGVTFTALVAHGERPKLDQASGRWTQRYVN